MRCRGLGYKSKTGDKTVVSLIALTSTYSSVTLKSYNNYKLSDSSAKFSRFVNNQDVAK